MHKIDGRCHYNNCRRKKEIKQSKNVLEVYSEQFINELIELIASGFSIQNYLEEQKHN